MSTSGRTKLCKTDVVLQKIRTAVWWYVRAIRTRAATPSKGWRRGRGLGKVDRLLNYYKTFYNCKPKRRTLIPNGPSPKRERGETQYRGCSRAKNGKKVDEPDRMQPWWTHTGK